MTATDAGLDRLRPLLLPDIDARPGGEGFLDLLPPEPVLPVTRSQSLWASRRGPQIYLRLVQPVVRSLGAPPDAAALAAGLRLAADATVLDVGCGPGVITAGLADAVGPDGLAVGLDVSTPMLRRAVAAAPGNMALVRGDAMRLPFRDSSFDAVCATAVLMLVADPRAAVAEIVRVLRPGGWLAIVVACRGTGLVGRLGSTVGKIAGGRMFRPTEIAALVEEFDVDHVHSEANGLISTTCARRSGGGAAG